MANAVRKKYPSQLQDRFIVRLPDGMRDRLSAAAKENGRSMNSELVARLEASIQADNETEQTVSQLWNWVEDLRDRMERVEGEVRSMDSDITAIGRAVDAK